MIVLVVEKFFAQVVYGCFITAPDEHCEFYWSAESDCDSDGTEIITFNGDLIT
jgi:hypothetical protein